MQETRLFQSCMCFHLCVMIYAFVDSFISQFEFAVPSIYSRSELFHHASGARPVICSGSRMPMAPNGWHSMSLALNIWKPQKDNKVRDNLRGLLGSYFHHSDYPRKFMGSFNHITGWLICEHQPGPIKKPWGSSVVWKLFVPSCMVEALRLQALGPSVQWHPLRSVMVIQGNEGH